MRMGARTAVLGDCVMDSTGWLLVGLALGVLSVEVARRRAAGRGDSSHRRRSGKGRRGGASGRAAYDVHGEDLFGPDDEELRARLAAVAAEGDGARAGLLLTRLTHLRAHRVPVRTIRRSPGRGVARLGFADGTVILARSAVRGALPHVAVLAEKGGVVISEVSPHPEGFEITLAGLHGQSTRLVALGLDQGD